MYTANNDPIANALGITPITPAENTNVIKRLEQQANDDTAKEDFTIARSNIHNIIDTGSEALDKLMQIADQSQQARAYEVVAILMKNLLDANKDLLAIQKSIREISDIEKPTNNTTVNHNNLFVGSTAELQKVIQDMRKND
jgi:MFS superfamily sulfate permease-like transporter